MTGGMRKQPKVLRGAFVEFGLSVPPLVVVFQFNPLQLYRGRDLSFSVPVSAQTGGEGITLRDFHQGFESLTELRDAQRVTVQPESVSFEIRLDATDKLNEGDAVTELHGIAPQLATLELMVQPKSESPLGQGLTSLLPGGFSFTCGDPVPLILFVWGRKRVQPVNIDNLQIIETEFSPDLNPIRATVDVNLTVIEGPNAAYKYSKVMTEFISTLNLGNLKRAGVTDVIIPG